MTENISVWGITVSIPHFLTAILELAVKNLPQELLLPDVSKMWKPQESTVSAHRNLIHYLPSKGFGDTIVSGFISYPKYPLKDVVYVITNNDWVLLHNFQEITISRPTAHSILDRLLEILRFGDNMFLKPFPSAHISKTTIFTNHFPASDELLNTLEEGKQTITPANLFKNMTGDRHKPVEEWFTRHGDSIVKNTQFMLAKGNISISTSVTGGELLSYSFNGVNPQTITFSSFTTSNFSDIVNDLKNQQQR